MANKSTHSTSCGRFTTTWYWPNFSEAVRLRRAAGTKLGQYQQTRGIYSILNPMQRNVTSDLQTVPPTESPRLSKPMTARAQKSVFFGVFWTVLLGTSQALALDIWTQPNPGIRHLHRTTPAPAEFHALVIDLNVPGVSVRCTPLRERWKATSTYARNSNLAAAINGGFWGGLQGAQGLAAGGGQVWSSDDADFGFFAFLRDGHAMVSRPSDVVEAGRRGITDGVSGRPLIVDRSRVSDELHAFENRNAREPRTAVGVSEDGKTVILVTVDGRRATSHGGTLYEMADLLIELGAYRGDRKSVV